jgi:hypothetical protein
MPAPAFFGPEFVVNTATAGAQRLADVAALANGKFVAVWYDESGIGGDADLGAIKGQLYNADGTRLGDEFLVNEVTASVQIDPKVAALTDGRFVATWTDFSGVGGDDSSSGIKARIFGPDGTPAAGEFLVNTTIGLGQFAADVAGLTTGGFALTWLGAQGASGEIRARAFNAAGTALGDDFLVDGDGVDNTRAVIAGLPDGRYVIAWTDSGTPVETDGFDSHIRAGIFFDNGAMVGGEFVVNTTATSFQTDPAVARLPTGGFVVTWTDQSNGNLDVRGRVFSNLGTPLDDDFGIDTSTSGNEVGAVVTGLADGSTFAAWTDMGGSGETDGSSWHIRGEILSGVTGGTLSGEFVANTTATNFQAGPTVATLADGRVVVLWNDGSSSPPDTSGSAVRGQIFDPRTAGVTLTGTTLADDWVGTPFADVMNGLGGNDSLAGAAGNDRLDGGLGADTMNGAAGNDIYVVDNALDRIIESGVGSDTVFARASFALSATAPVETLAAAVAAATTGMTLAGSNTANTVTGNNGVNTLRGLGGNDNLQGLAGNDILDGGIGNDVLSGGLGRDTLTGGLGADRFDFNLVSESPRGGGRDTVNFSHAQRDKIDLRDIDADTDGTAGNQAFRFIRDAAFHGVDGELRFARGILQGDVNGDRVADFEIRVVGTLTTGDIIL